MGKPIKLHVHEMTTLIYNVESKNEWKGSRCLHILFHIFIHVIVVLQYEIIITVGMFTITYYVIADCMCFLCLFLVPLVQYSFIYVLVIFLCKVVYQNCIFYYSLDLGQQFQLMHLLINCI